MVRRVLSYVLFLAAFAVGPALSQEPQASRLTEMATADANKGWEAVGRLDTGRGSFCTGALISSDLVLTAAHCLFDADTGRRIPLRELEFMAGLRNGRADAYRSVRRAVPHPEYVFGEPRNYTRVARDLALVELDRPIRSSRIVPFDISGKLGRGDEVTVVSYAEHRAEAPSIQQVCHVLESYSGVVMLSCSVDYGSSGAPIFVMGEDGPSIASVVSSKAESKGKPVSLAGELHPSMTVLQAEMLKAPSGVLNRGNTLARERDDRATGRLGAKFLRP